jgi:hypothetical protein
VTLNKPAQRPFFEKAPNVAQCDTALVPRLPAHIGFQCLSNIRGWTGMDETKLTVWGYRGSPTNCRIPDRFHRLFGLPKRVDADDDHSTHHVGNDAVHDS